MRIRARVKGVANVPRLSVFRSNRYTYAQLIDDEKGITLAQASDLKEKNRQQSKTERAKQTGKLLAKKSLEKKIRRAVFDRGGYKYHGRIKELAEGARESGLKI